jgi:hypothetical protein
MCTWFLYSPVEYFGYRFLYSPVFNKATYPRRADVCPLLVAENVDTYPLRAQICPLLVAENVDTYPRRAEICPLPFADNMDT